MSAGSMRARLLGELADEISRAAPRRVAVDGVDGVGKTTFTDELAHALAGRDRRYAVIHADDYLNPAEIRHRRDRRSPEGFWLDSIDLDGLRRAIDSTPGPTLVEGIFLHRDELADLWDYSLYLHAPFDITVARYASRDHADSSPAHSSNTRYVDGQRLYFGHCTPWLRADRVVDNTDLNHPRLLDADAVTQMNPLLLGAGNDDTTPAPPTEEARR